MSYKFCRFVTPDVPQVAVDEQFHFIGDLEVDILGDFALAERAAEIGWVRDVLVPDELLEPNAREQVLAGDGVEDVMEAFREDVALSSHAQPLVDLVGLEAGERREQDKKALSSRGENLNPPSPLAVGDALFLHRGQPVELAERVLLEVELDDCGVRRGREVRRLRAGDGRPLHAPGPGASLEPVAADQISRGTAKRVRLAGGLLDHVSELVREQRAIGRPASRPEPDVFAAREPPRPGGAGRLAAGVDPHPAEVVAEARAHGLPIRPGQRLPGARVRGSVPGRLQALEQPRRPVRSC